MKPFRIALPATSANLGPAFDAAALAFGLFLKVKARPAKEFSIVARGRDQKICGKIQDHLILTTYRDVLQAGGKNITPLALTINNEFPIGKGCGSSAAARLAGIALANHFGKLRWNDARIVGDARDANTILTTRLRAGWAALLWPGCRSRPKPSLLVSSPRGSGH